MSEIQAETIDQHAATTANRSPLPTWVVLAIPGLAVGLIFLFSMIAIIPLLARGSKVDATQVALASIPAQLVAYLVLTWIIARLVRGYGAPNFFAGVQWHWPRTKQASAIAAAGAVCAMVIAMLPIPIPRDLPIEQLMRVPQFFALFAVLGVIPGPFVEELYFRGLLFPVVRNKLGAVAAVLLTALPFALMHGGQLAFAAGPLSSLFAVGCILALIREKTGSLAASFLFHAFYNTTLLSFSFLTR